MYTYVIKAREYRALAVKSDLLFMQLQDLIRRECKVDPVTKVRTWYYGVVPFVEPELMMLSDFGDSLPAMVG